MRWRKLAAGVFELSATPVIVIASGIPRRQFNLPWLVASDEFLAIRSEYVAWQNRHFEVIEQGAPWLHLIGRDVYQTAHGGVPRSRGFSIFRRGRAPASAAEALLARQALRPTGDRGSHTAVEDAVSAQFRGEIPAFTKPTFARFRETHHSAQYYHPSAPSITKQDASWAIRKATEALSGVKALPAASPPEAFI